MDVLKSLKHIQEGHRRLDVLLGESVGCGEHFSLFLDLVPGFVTQFYALGMFG